jgi:NADH-quinone oxidoreductase subunit C
MTPEELAESMERFDATASIDHGQLCVDVSAQQWIAALTHARDTLGCTYFDWLSGVDDLDQDPPGISIVAHVYSPVEHHHLLIRTRAPAADLRLPTASTVYKGANWHERETHEMFGVGFDGHPNLIPLLLPDGFDGSPLRKAFVLASRVAKQWPGELAPGQRFEDLKPGRKRNLPPGVPTPDEWGPKA